jgi:polyhydroxyalkanoate synthase
MNLWNREYMNGFDAMNEWVNQFIDYPRAAFQQFVHDFMRHNKLARGKMTFRGKAADLAKVRASLFVVAGSTDQVAQVAAVKAAMETVGSKDKTFRLAPGGHMGVFAGSTAPEHVWKPAAEWLTERSTGIQRPAAGGQPSPVVRAKRAARRTKAARGKLPARDRRVPGASGLSAAG